MAKIFLGIPIFNLQNPIIIENQKKAIETSSHQVIYSYVVGHSVEHARQVLIDRFLETDCEFYLTMDADIMFLGKDNPIDKFHSLLADDNIDILGGLYFYKRPPCLPVYRPLDLQNIYEKEGMFPINYKFKIPDKVFEVAWVGNGFKMVKRRVIEEIKKMIKVPNLPMIHKGEYISEDWAFDQRAKNLGFKVWIDPTTKLGHAGFHFYTKEDFDKYNGSN